MTDYVFFLSYARRNDLSRALSADDDKSKKLIRRLYEDLAAELINGGVMQSTKLEEVGFFDQVGIEPGDQWDVTVAEALRTARVMLCLFTRNYFNSKVCGQEFEVFRRRVKKYADANAGRHAPLIIPVLWHRPDRLPTLPKAVVDLQYTYDEFNDVYTREGLEYVMRLEKHRDDYEQFVMKLRDHVIDVTARHQLEPLSGVPPLTEVPNPFETKLATAVADTQVEPENGPSFVHFAYVVGDKQQLANAGTKLERYGADGRSWKPYIPDVDKPVGLITQRVATDVDLQHEVLPITATLIDHLKKADETNTIVVLIVDPWTLKVQNYLDLMKEYDSRNLVSCGVLVVWSGNEQERGEAEAALRPNVNWTFANTLINNNTYIRPRVTSEMELRNEVTASIIEIRRRLNERAKLFRPVDPAGFAAIPQVATPGGGPA